MFVTLYRYAFFCMEHEFPDITCPDLFERVASTQGFWKTKCNTPDVFVKPDLFLVNWQKHLPGNSLDPGGSSTPTDLGGPNQTVPGTWFGANKTRAHRLCAVPGHQGEVWPAIEVMMAGWSIGDGWVRLRMPVGKISAFCAGIVCFTKIKTQKLKQIVCCEIWCLNFLLLMFWLSIDRLEGPGWCSCPSILSCRWHPKDMKVKLEVLTTASYISTDDRGNEDSS